MFNTNQKVKKGTVLYFSILIMSVLFSIGIGLSLIIFNQIKILRGVGDSVIALKAADTGVERALYALYTEGITLPYSTSSILENGASFIVQINPSSTCPTGTQYYCIKSVGTFKGTKRAIDASF
jgi:Tfp pilus assembly protein PilX